MKNLLIGNGINIQFGDNEYCNENIIRRAIGNLENNNYNPELYPFEVGNWLKLLHKEYPNLLDGLYDKLFFTSDVEEALKSFKERYKHRGKYLTIDEIGFEDYFIIHEILCRSEMKYFEKRFKNQDNLRRLFLDSIYNSGKIQNIYKKFPVKFKSYVENYSSIFTTNYDRNIEIFTKKTVFYLHGAFHVLDEVYNQNSLRNQLSDAPVKKTPVIKGHEYLFSNALITGYSKLHNITINSKANVALSKANDAHKKNEFKFESLSKSDVVFLRNLSEVIKLQSENPSLSINEYYPIKEFKKIKGTIDIIGLSPNNDNHLFETINSNSDLQSVRFYYYDIDDIDFVKKAFSNLKVEFIDIRNLWKKIS